MEEPTVEVQSDDALSVADRVELTLGEIAGGGADGMDIGVRCDQRCVRDGRDVPEAGFIEMGQVDHDAEPVALAHQRFAEIGQSRTGVRRGRELKGNAIAEPVRAGPGDTERAEPGLKVDLKRVEFWVNRLRALEMELHRE